MWSREPNEPPSFIDREKTFGSFICDNCVPDSLQIICTEIHPGQMGIELLSPQKPPGSMLANIPNKYEEVNINIAQCIQMGYLLYLVTTVAHKSDL